MRTRACPESSHFQCRRWCSCLVIVLYLSFGSSRADEPNFVATQQKGVDANPPGVAMTIEFANRQTRFRVGELIPLDIVYRFKDDAKLLINDGLCRDCGTARMLEVFHVSPHAGTRSMTREEPNFHVWAGGTPMNVKNFTYRYRVYLNEWRRFDSPGRYQFYSESARVWAPDVYPQHDNKVRVTSNLLEIEIIPAEVEWQADQVRQAMSVLQNNLLPATDADSKLEKHQKQRLSELRRLRYLDTELATRQLARLETGQDDLEGYETAMGLLQSKFKAVAVDELERRMQLPEFPITQRYIQQLASLAADVQIPIDYSQRHETAESLKRLQQLEAKNYELQKAMLHKYTEAARVAAELKSPLIKAKSLVERLRAAVDFRRDPHPPQGQELAKIQEAILAEFQRLSMDEQASVLGPHWRQLRRVEYLPVLRQFVAEASEVRDLNAGYSRVDRALNRIWELAPEEGVVLVEAELKRSEPRAELGTFKRVLTRPDPSLDKLLIDRVENSSEDVEYHDREIAAKLLAHLGSPESYDRILRLFNENDEYGGDIRSALLAYLIRHNATEGTRLVNEEINSHFELHFRPVLNEIAEAHMCDALETIAIQRLGHAHPEIAEQVVWLLGQHGLKRTEKALWNRLEEWHAGWKDRTEELKDDDTSDRRNSQVQLERALAFVIARSEIWFTDIHALHRLRALCLSELTRKEVDDLVAQWSEPIEIRLFPGTQTEFPSAVWRGGIWPIPPNDNWNVAQYRASSLVELKSLLARFPTGTTFAFPSDVLTDEAAEQELFADIQSSLARHGCKLVKVTKPQMD